MTCEKRQKIILNKMKAKGIEEGSEVPNKKHNSKEVNEIIHISNFFSEFRLKNN